LRWAGKGAVMREEEGEDEKENKEYRLLVGKPEGKRSIRKPSHRQVYNIKLDLGEIEWGSVT
jgi:hypothetical protein